MKETKDHTKISLKDIFTYEHIFGQCSVYIQLTQIDLLNHSLSQMFFVIRLLQENIRHVSSRLLRL